MALWTARAARATRVVRPEPRRVLRALAVVLGLVIAGCDSGPNGPGLLEGTVSAPALGAVLLEVEGAGINGFEGRASTRVYAGTLSGRPNVHRVILMDRDGGSLAFAIDVDDLGMDGPVVTVIQAAGTDDEPMSAGSLRVALVR